MQRLLADLARRGLVETRPGSGTYTAPRRVVSAPADVSWQTLALGSRAGLGADLEQLIEPVPVGAISMASGFLDKGLQPLGLLAAAASRAARRPQAWNRLPAQGLTELRVHIAAETGAALGPENVIITPGGQAALSAAFRHLCAPGDPVIMDSPTYVGAIAAARAAGLTMVPVPGDGDGMPPDGLTDALARTGARMVYLQPRHSNPTGAVLSRDRRDEILALVARHGAFLIEDDWMRDFDLGPPSPPPLASLDDNGHVIYLRSLSKPVAPGLRVAGLAARGPALVRLRRGRISDDLFVAPVLQQVALDVLTAAGWSRHLGGVRRVLRQRRDALVSAIGESLPQCELPVVPGRRRARVAPAARQLPGARGRRVRRRPWPGREPGPDVVPRRAAGRLPAAELRGDGRSGPDQRGQHAGRGPSRRQVRAPAPVARGWLRWRGAGSGGAGLAPVARGWLRRRWGWLRWRKRNNSPLMVDHVGRFSVVGHFSAVFAVSAPTTENCPTGFGLPGALFGRPRRSADFGSR